MIRRPAIARAASAALGSLLFLLLAAVPALAGTQSYTIDELLAPTVPNVLLVYVPLGLVAAALCVIAFLRPAIGLLFYVLLLPFRSFVLANLGPIAITAPDLIAPPMILGWLITGTWRSERPRLPFRRTGLEAPLLLFTGWVILSLFWSVGYVATISKILQMIYALLLFYMGVELVKTPRYLAAVMTFWVLGAVINAGAGLGHLVTTGDRSGGVNVNTLEAAMYSLMGIGLTIGIWTGLQRGLAKTLVTLALMIQMGGFVITQARGPMIGLAAGLVVPFAISRDTRRLVLWGLGLIAAAYLLAWVASFFYPMKIPNIIGRLVHTGGMRDVGEAYRQDIWATIIFHLIPASPLLGIGAGSLDGIMMNWGHVQLFPEKTAHSMYLEVLVGLGPIGLALMAWFWGAYFLRLVRIFRQVDDRLCKGVLLGGLIVVISKCVSAVTYGFYIEDRYQWTALGIILGFAKVGLEQRGVRTEMSDEPLEETMDVAGAAPATAEPVEDRPRFLPKARGAA